MPTFSSSSVSHIATGQTAGVSTALQTYEAALNALVSTPVPYTPTFAGTGTAIGNGTINGYYLQTGKLVTFGVHITLGTTTTIGTTAQSVTLPVQASGVSLSRFGVHVRYVHGAADWQGQGLIYGSGLIAYIGVPGTNGAYTVLTSTVPFTWAITDTIDVFGQYWAA